MGQNTLPHPVRTSRLEGGGMLVAVKCVDFLDAQLDHARLLESDVLIGATIRLRWKYKVSRSWNLSDKPAERSQRVRLRLGEYAGQSACIDALSRNTEGRYVAPPSSVPIFAAKLWKDNGSVVDIGQLAIGRLAEGERAVVEGADFNTLKGVLDFPRCDYWRHASQSCAQAHVDFNFGAVQVGGLYVATKSPDQDALALSFYNPKMPAVFSSTGHSPFE